MPFTFSCQNISPVNNAFSLKPMSNYAMPLHPHQQASLPLRDYWNCLLYILFNFVNSAHSGRENRFGEEIIKVWNNMYANDAVWMCYQGNTHATWFMVIHQLLMYSLIEQKPMEELPGSFLNKDFTLVCLIHLCDCGGR